MRRIGINLEAWPDAAPDEFIRTAREQGFTAMFTATKDAETTERLAKLMEEAGIAYETIHAPYRNIINDMWSEGEAAEFCLSQLCGTVDRCAQVNVPIAVVHLATAANRPTIEAPPITEAGYRNFSRLIEYAGQRGVTLAFENQLWLANLAWILEYFDSVPHVRFCWDCGHEGCLSPGREYMPLFGHKLVCLHINDNQRIFRKDQHMIPFDGTVDFARVAHHIRESGYEGTLMLELKGKKSGFYDDLTPTQFLARAYAAAERLRTMIELL